MTQSEIFDLSEQLNEEVALAMSAGDSDSSGEKDSSNSSESDSHERNINPNN